jgi:hypothetical protein
MRSIFERIISTIYYKRCNLLPNHILTGQPRDHGSISGRGNVYRPVLEPTQPIPRVVQACTGRLIESADANAFETKQPTVPAFPFTLLGLP